MPPAIVICLAINPDITAQVGIIVTPTKSSTFRWTPNPPLLVLAILLFPVLVSLGIWQLGRAEEKRNIEAMLNERQSQPPVNLVQQTQMPPFTRVIVQGAFDNSRIWLVDNRQRDGRPGFEVVQPFVVSTGLEVLINRGWLPAPEKREQLPDIKLLEGNQTIFASVVMPTHHPMLSAKSKEPGWPKIITQIIPEEMQVQSEMTPDYYLNIDPASPGALRTEWQAVNMKSSKHTGYAVQWFAMAFVLLILSVFANSNLASIWRQRRIQRGKS